MAKLDVNQAPTPDEPTPEGNMAEVMEVKQVLKLYGQGKEARKEYDKNWNKYWEFYKGKQWGGGQQRSSYRASVPFNIMRSTVQTQIPIMTDSRPKFTVLPREPQDWDFAQMMSKVIEDWWSRSGMDLSMVDYITDSMILSAAIGKITWDSDAMDGLGDVKCELVDPRDIYVNKEARDFTQDKNCRWVIQKSRRTVGELRRQFPDKADQITSDVDDRTIKEQDYAGDVVLTSPVDQRPRTEQEPNQSGGVEDVVDVMECWMFDETLIELELQNEEGGKEKIVKKKFPQGKLTTILPNQHLLLQEVENPYKDGKFPYIRLVDTQLPRKFWGEGESEPLLEIQKAINKVANSMIDHINIMGNPIWKVHKTSGVNAGRLTNQVGLVVNWQGDHEPRRETPDALGADYFQFYNQLIRFAEGITGVQEISQGRRPEGVTAAQALDTLQEAAQTRIRLKERNLESFLVQMGELVISRIMQFVKEPRVARITGEQGWPEFFEYFIDHPDDEGEVDEDKYRMNIQKYETDETGVQKVGEFEAGEGSKGMFDLKVVSGTALPFQKNQKGNLALRLFDAGVLAQTDVLEAVEWPDKEKVIRNKEEEDQKLMEQQQAQQPQEGA